MWELDVQEYLLWDCKAELMQLKIIKNHKLQNFAIAQYGKWSLNSSISDEQKIDIPFKHDIKLSVQISLTIFTSMSSPKIT